MPKHKPPLPETPMPFSPAGQAAALAAAPQATCLSSCTAAPGVMYGASIVSRGSYGPICQPRPDNYGGLTGMDMGPYYDPRTTSIRSPVAPDGTTVITAPSMKHGPDAFDATYTPTPKTQFAPHGTIEVAGTYELPLYRGPCVCVGRCDVVWYSMQQLLLRPGVVSVLRDMLVQSGTVSVSPELAAVPAEALCSCRLLGGPDNFEPWAAFAGGYSDFSTMQVLEPVTEALKLCRMYVETEVLGPLRSTIIAQARMNYLRAEGPRAFLTPHTFDEDTDVSVTLPAVLPGTGCRVSEADTPFAARALTDPRSSALHRAQLAARTGLAIGDNTARDRPSPWRDAHVPKESRLSSPGAFSLA